ncbi:MAG: kinase [bacterium]
MIITRTPLRISFLGGGTDYPEHFRRHGGQTLGTTIDKYSYVTLNRLAELFDYTIRIGYSRTELVTHLEQIQHPAVRECLRFLSIERGVEIGYAGDLPARTGLGSSSSFTVGLLHALHAFRGELVHHQQLACEAVQVEQDMIRERVGVQDQYLCAHGGLRHLRIDTDGTVMANPIPMSSERRTDLERHLMLLYTGLQRHAHEVLEEQIDRTREGTNAPDLEALSALVPEGVAILSRDSIPITEFGGVLDAAWRIKCRLSSKVSNPKLDDWYERARAAGAVGGKLLGAGGGGFLLLLAPPSRQPEVLAALPELRPVPFRFEREGSTLLFYRPA